MTKRTKPDEVKIVTLRELKPGDRFYPSSQFGKNRLMKYTVKSDCQYNSGHGSSTRICYNTTTGELESKSCNLKVIKL